MRRKRTHAPEIPEAFEHLANRWNLTIDHKYGLRSYFVRDACTGTPLISYREAEFMGLTAETLEDAIEQALDNYTPPEPFDPIEHERLNRRPQHIPTGHWQ